MRGYIPIAHKLPRMLELPPLCSASTTRPNKAEREEQPWVVSVLATCQSAVGLLAHLSHKAMVALQSEPEHLLEPCTAPRQHSATHTAMGRTAKPEERLHARAVRAPVPDRTLPHAR